jgi:hypothetical protein
MMGTTVKQQLAPVNYGPGPWIFFGCIIDENNSDLQEGCEEHHSMGAMIHHDGSFHCYQMPDVKDWHHVKPTNDLLLERIVITKEKNDELEGSPLVHEVMTPVLLKWI